MQIFASAGNDHISGKPSTAEQWKLDDAATALVASCSPPNKMYTNGGRLRGHGWVVKFYQYLLHNHNFSNSLH